MFSPVSRALTMLVAAAGLASSCAALALPASSYDSEIAAILALGALALLAGHQWGLVVVAAADVVLLGQLWPLLLRTWPPTITVQLVMYTAMAGALPGLVLLPRALRQGLDLLLGSSTPTRVRTAATWCGMLLGIWSLVVPGL